MSLKTKEKHILLALVCLLVFIWYFNMFRAIPHLSQDTELRLPTRAIRRVSKSVGVFEQDLLPNKDRVFTSTREIWQEAESWVESRHIYPERNSYLGNVLHAMKTSKIIYADVGFKGTQLKLLLTLEGNQYVVFKPMRYPRDHVILGSPYGGYDRHNAEIAGFHLDRLLDFRRSPLVVGRRVNLVTEIIPVATQKLKDTFFLDSSNSTCFYGVCYYCRKEEPACGQGAMMEGSVTLWFPRNFKLGQKRRHPWGRTYIKGQDARWEVDDTYCDSVKKATPYNSGPILLDIIDACIFDYLIGNADRHHYETFKDDGARGMLLLLDNGKSFGNPDHDEKSILAPLYQCCQMRKSTYRRLLMFKEGRMSSALRSVLTYDPLSPILTEQHLEAMDRRLITIFYEIDKCSNQLGGTNKILIPFGAWDSSPIGNKHLL